MRTKKDPDPCAKRIGEKTEETHYSTTLTLNAGVVNPMERAAAYLDKIPGAVSGNGGHRATFKAAFILTHGFGLDSGAVRQLMDTYNLRCAPPWSASELEHKVTSAAQAVCRRPGWLLDGAPPASRSHPTPAFVPSRPPVPRLADIKPDLEHLEKLAEPLTWFIEEELKMRSPIDPGAVTPVTFLEALFRPGEKVLIFDMLECKTPAVVAGIESEPGDPAGLDFMRTGKPQGVWFLPQPVDGQWRDGSCRSARCVSGFRFVVLESDSLEPELFLRLLARLPINIAAVTTSGGKSLHALWRISAFTAHHWKHLADPYKPALAMLGCDAAALSCVRLSRLPCCRRESKNQWQRLLFLDPSTDETPLAERPHAPRLNFPY